MDLKKPVILLFLILVFLKTELRAQVHIKVRRFDSTIVDTSYFLSAWKKYEYYMENGKKHKVLIDMSPTFNCCGELKRQKIPCEKYVEIVRITRNWEDPNVFVLFWLCEKGRINLKFKLPDTLFVDERLYTNDAYIWKAKKIKYINKNEFVIYDVGTYEGKKLFNHYVRLTGKELEKYE